MEDQESLEGRAVICKITSAIPAKNSLCLQNHTSNAANLVDNGIDKFLSNGIMSSGIVVCRILLAAHEEFWMKERAIFTSADFVDWRGIEIDEDRSWDIFASTGLGEEGLEGAWVGI